MLINYELSAEAHGKDLQRGLDFTGAVPELSSGDQMGEDALRVLTDYRKLLARIRTAIKNELSWRQVVEESLS